MAEAYNPRERLSKKRKLQLKGSSDNGLTNPSDGKRTRRSDVEATEILREEGTNTHSQGKYIMGFAFVYY